MHRPDPVEQFHGIRGGLVGDVLTSALTGDVLMQDSVPAVHTFQVPKRPRTAALLLR